MWSTRADLEAALRTAGLGDWAPRLAQLARHCIILVPGPIEAGAAAPVGACRLGGEPDLPPSVEWPVRPPFRAKWGEDYPGPVPGRVLLGRSHWLHRLFRTRRWQDALADWERSGDAKRDIRNRPWPLSFVAQIDFAELLAVHPLDGFPPTGRLLLFCDPFDWPWGEREDQARVHVVLTGEPAEHLARRRAPRAFDEPAGTLLMPRGFVFKPRALRPTAWLLPPQLRSREIAALRADQPAAWAHQGSTESAYQQFWADLYASHPATFGPSGESIHQVGGTAVSIQEPVEAACAKFAAAAEDSQAQRDSHLVQAEDWQLVLQIDSDIEVGMEWGDVGRLYLCARRHDLVARRFDRCWMVMQCY